MQKKEPKTCTKCGEPYFGDHCIGCHSNQYAHYDENTPIKTKLLILFAVVIIVGLILLNK